MGTVHLKDLRSGQPVAGHAVGAVGQIYLDILIDSKVVILLTLVLDLVH